MVELALIIAAFYFGGPIIGLIALALSAILWDY